MSGQQYLQALASERAHSRMLRTIIFVVAAIGALGAYQAWRTPKTIVVHLLPNITADSAIMVTNGLSTVPPQNVYAFGYYIWQQINHWPSDGLKDYPSQIKAMHPYLTPQCQAQLSADVQARTTAGELNHRTRTIEEITGLGYSPKRVVDEGNGQSWTVYLDSQIQESFQGMKVKDVFIRYPLRVVHYDVDRELNPWQLAIDCFGANMPARLSEADLRPQDRSSPNTPLSAPSLPSEVRPASLPDAVTQPASQLENPGLIEGNGGAGAVGGAGAANEGGLSPGLNRAPSRSSINASSPNNSNNYPNYSNNAISPAQERAGRYGQGPAQESAQQRSSADAPPSVSTSAPGAAPESNPGMASALRARASVAATDPQSLSAAPAAPPSIPANVTANAPSAVSHQISLPAASPEPIPLSAPDTPLP